LGIAGAISNGQAIKILENKLLAKLERHPPPILLQTWTARFRWEQKRHFRLAK